MTRKVRVYDESMSGRVFERVYEVVKGIPRGEVMTYGEVAQLAETTARVVGWAMHANKTPAKIPCHRVVGKGGVLRGYAFGGWKEQKRKLLAEGVRFVGERVVCIIPHGGI